MCFGRVLWTSLMLVVFLSGIVLADDNEELEAIRHIADTGKHAQALRRLEAYIEQHPKKVQARFLQGVIFVRQQRVQEAIASFKALTRDYPELPEPYNNLAVLYASQGQYDKARDALLAAINTHPSYAKAHENLGNVYARMARIAYSRALELNQESKTTQLKLHLINRLFLVQNDGVVTTAAAASSSAPRAPVPSQPKSSTPRKVAAQNPAVETRRIIESVRAWARAWASKDVDAYLAFYAPDFRPPEGQTRQAWRKLRRERVRELRFIKIRIGNPKVALLSDSVARVRFRQDYRSNIYRGETDKLLLLNKRGSRWRILEERVIR
jgi:tetratricopeptide (TPR) repeat protein